MWERALAGPLLMVAGGSGVVPFRSMLRHWAASDRPVAARLLLSARSLQDVIYRDELAASGADVRVALTREWPEDWDGHRGRIDAELLADVAWPAADDPRTFICGPTSFVEAAATALVAHGVPPGSIKTERFGATGG